MISTFRRHWQPDGRDALPAHFRILLSIVVTAVVGYLLEYLGTEVFKAFRNANPNTIYFATAIWGLVGLILVGLRRSSIFMSMAIVGGGFALIVLVNHFYFVKWALIDGVWQQVGLRSPRIWEFTDGKVLGISSPLPLAMVAGVIQTVVVPVSVALQKILTLPWSRRVSEVDLRNPEKLFRDSVVATDELRIRLDFGFVLMRFISIAYGLNLAYQALGLFVGGRDLPIVNLYFLNPAATVNSFMKLSLMMFLAAIGAYNRSVRRPMAILLAIGHGFAVGTALWLYFGYPPNPNLPIDHSFVGASALGDGILIVLLIVVIFLRPNQPGLPTAEEDLEVSSPISRLYRLYFLAFAIAFTAFSVAIVGYRGFGSPYTGLGAVFGFPDALVVNSVAKYATLAALGWCLLLVPSLRRFLIPVIATSFLISLLVTFWYGLQGTTKIVTRFGNFVDLPYFMVQHIIVDGSGLVLLLMLRRRHYNFDFQIMSLSPGAAECAMALHGAMREGEVEHPGTRSRASRDVLRRIDEHMVGMRGRLRGLLALPFEVLEYVLPFFAFGRPPFSTMSVEQQRLMLRRHVLRPPWERTRASNHLLSDVGFRVGDTLHAFTTFAYYSSCAGQQEVGYVLPDARERLQSGISLRRPPIGADPVEPPRSLKDSLSMTPPSAVQAKILPPRIGAGASKEQFRSEVDYLIIGSGAAGAVLADRLSELKPGAEICVLERGGYFRPSIDFTDDEMAMYRSLYADGGLQSTRRMDFSILQGECVGGSTVVNNAVCIRMPDVVRSEWTTLGVDLSDIDGHYDRVKHEINIAPLDPLAANEKIEELFRKGVDGFNRQHGGTLSQPALVEANLQTCVGCGLCTLGCKRLRKLSMLETYLTWAQSRGVCIISGTGAVRAVAEPAGFGMARVTQVIARRHDGSFQTIRVRKAVIVSAGAVASSRFLLRSGVGGKHVGQGLSCNFAVPPVAEFPQSIEAFDGFQMLMSASGPDHRMIFEPSFNPPGAYSIGIPLHFRQHAQLMAAYRNAVNFTALVGSQPVGRVSRKRDFLFGRTVDWEPTPEDISRVRDAMVVLLRIAQAAGGNRMYLPTQPGLVVPLDARMGGAVDLLHRVFVRPEFFNWFTAHPQGGNRLGPKEDPTTVLDSDFRVHDCTNLYVCDASVFPRSVRVNPQWTIMALASMAGERIARAT